VKQKISIKKLSNLNLLSTNLRVEFIENMTEYDERASLYESELSKGVYDKFMADTDNIEKLSDKDKDEKYIECLKVLNAGFDAIYDRPIKDILGANYNIFKKTKIKVFDYRIFIDPSGRQPLVSLIEKKDYKRFITRLLDLKEDKYIFAVSDECNFNGTVGSYSVVIPHVALGLINTETKKLYTPIPNEKNGSYHWDNLTEKEIEAMKL